MIKKLTLSQILEILKLGINVLKIKSRDVLQYADISHSIFECTSPSLNNLPPSPYILKYNLNILRFT